VRHRLSLGRRIVDVDQASGGRRSARTGQHCASFYPGMTILARSCRYFTARVIHYLTAAGIRQFLDIGCGLPAPAGNTHQIAQAIVPVGLQCGVGRGRGRTPSPRRSAGLRSAGGPTTGDGPERNLERRPRWSAAFDSAWSDGP
jgi:hypothetical protein